MVVMVVVVGSVPLWDSGGGVVSAVEVEGSESARVNNLGTVNDALNVSSADRIVDVQDGNRPVVLGVGGFGPGTVRDADLSEQFLEGCRTVVVDGVDNLGVGGEGSVVGRCVWPV